jgi:hypothetical protein
MIKGALRSRWALGLLVVILAAALILGASVAGDSIRQGSQKATSAAQQAQAKAERASLKRLRAAEYGLCHRQNLRSVNGNRNNYSTYKLWSSLLELLEFSADQPSSAKPNPRAAELYDAFLASMKTQVHTLAWTPLSNCEQSTDHPVSYAPPEAIPFSQQTPPLSAFTIGPNE